MTSHLIFRRLPEFLKVVALTLLIASSMATRASAQTVFINLHNLAFTNGSGPNAALIVSGNTLYGTTHKYGGGTGGGSGSVFKMNIDGSGFTNLHTFSGYAPDPGALYGDLVLLGGTLYGTAIFGGDLDHGCIFAIGTNGFGLTNIYSFSTNSNFTNFDGANPSSGLLLAGSTFYGTTSGGGTNGGGTLFAMNTNGTGFTNLHNFDFATGNYPGHDLILSGATFYGTTPSGGSSGVGTVFKINTNGAGYTNFYSFSQTSGPDRTNSEGAFPACSLVLSGTNLYGTVSEGGDLGGGTIFKFDTNGTAFIILHAFETTNGVSGTNIGGARPMSGLNLVSNVLYGTTSMGGPFGGGTVFKINTDGTGFTALYNFTATNGPNVNGYGTNSDGTHPIGGLLFAGGTLYGTAGEGGVEGYGTIFSLSTAPALMIALAGTNAILTWPTNLVGFNLQSTTNLTPPGVWDPVAGQYSVTNPITAKQRFYRLMHP